MAEASRRDVRPGMADAPMQPAVRGAGVRQSGLSELWKTLKADSTLEEVIRNFFIRQSVLWVDG